jgi:anti-anti-sigma factor
MIRPIVALAPPDVPVYTLLQSGQREFDMNTVVATQQGTHLTLKLSGRFTFSLYKEFAACYKHLTEQPEAIDVDLSDVEYVDSAALGMLLSMRNYFGPDKKISLLHANDTVKKIFEIARFDKKFSMS